jgi:foldase protein PrsA
MRNFILVLTAAALGGCNSSSFPTWRLPSRGGDTTPVSKPTEAMPAEKPAEKPAPAPATATATPSAPAGATPVAAPVVAATPAPTPLTDLSPARPAPAAPPPAAAPKAEPEMVAAPDPVVNAPPKPAQPGRAVMAYVNGEPVYMDQLNQLLISGYGLAAAQQLVANELVRQEAQRKGLAVTDAEVEAEHQRTMDTMFSTVSEPNQRQRLLEQLLKRNNVSQDQWNLTMRRNALLAKLADSQVQVAEEEVKEEFDRQYEQKVKVQHIQTATLADAQKVLKDLADGAEFTALVNKYSIGPTADKAGLLEPFGSRDTGTPPALRQVAMGMKKAGEVSDPIQVGTVFHILKLLAIIEPENVKYEDVRARLAADVRKRKAVALQQDILQILIRGGKLQYVDPILKTQADQGR